MKLAPAMPDTPTAVGQRLYDATKDYQRWAAKVKAPRRRETDAEMLASALAILRRLHDAIHTFEAIQEEGR